MKKYRSYGTERFLDVERFSFSAAACFVLLVGITFVYAEDANCCTTTAGTCVPLQECRGPGADAISASADSCRVCCVTRGASPQCTAYGGTGSQCEHQVACSHEPISGLCPEYTGATSCCPESADTSATPNLLWTHDVAARYLLNHTYNFSFDPFGCECRRAGCVSLDAVQSFAVEGLSRLFESSYEAQCPLTLSGGTEPGHSTSGLETHGTGYVLSVQATPCASSLLRKLGERTSITDRYRDCAELLTLSGAVACHNATFNRWELIFRNPRQEAMDETRNPFANGTAVLDVVVQLVSNLKNRNGTLVFPDDHGFMKRLGAACYLGLGTGGLFGVSRSVFDRSQALICHNASSTALTAEYIRIQLLLGQSYCALEYEATDAPIVSAVAARVVAGAGSIPERDVLQGQYWSSTFAPDPRCTIGGFFGGVTTEEMSLHLVFVLDSSGSVGSTNFMLAIEAIKLVLQSPSLTSDDRFALILYDTSARVFFNFIDATAAITMLASVYYSSGGTATDRAIDAAVALLAPIPKGLKMIMTMTDGETDEAPLVASCARIPSSVASFCIGVGQACPSRNCKRSQKGTPTVSSSWQRSLLF